MARSHLTIEQKIFVAQVVKEHCKSEDGFAVYDDGWSDDQVVEEAAREFGLGKVSKKQVVYIRQKLIAKELKPKPAPMPPVAAVDAESVQPQLIEMRVRLATLKQRVDWLEREVFKLSQPSFPTDSNIRTLKQPKTRVIK